MSTSNTQETEQLILKLLMKLERKGKNIKSFLWRLMDQFEDVQLDGKNDDEKKFNNNDKITLLYDHTAKHVCKVGHKIYSDKQKHLSIEPCVMCGHRNTNNQHKMKPKNKQQILKFVNSYNTQQIPFGPHPQQKQDIKSWVSKGKDKLWPLHYAAISGDTKSINQLCKNKNINIDEKITAKSNDIPITCASRYGQLESVIELIKHGANPIPPPDKSGATPYKCAVYRKHESIKIFLRQYAKYLYNFDVNNNTNVECYYCYNYDLHFNKSILNGTMAKYVYCTKCVLDNVQTVKKKKANNLIIESRIIKTLKENPSISVDTLCQMKDVKSLHTILKEMMVSGAKHGYWLWLLDIDNFKSINSHLTHAIADTKIQALGEVLKRYEPTTSEQWRKKGYRGLKKVYAFRQGGDEFALVVGCNNQRTSDLQKLYETLRNEINCITLENMDTMKHITVSIGVCHGGAIDNYEEMMKKADEAAEMVKNDGKNGIAIYHPYRKKIYKNFNEI